MRIDLHSYEKKDRGLEEKVMAKREWPFSVRSSTTTKTNLNVEQMSQKFAHGPRVGKVILEKSQHIVTKERDIIV